MKLRWNSFLISLAVPLGVGGLSALLTHESMEEFQRLVQPPLSPPGWVFPVVWTILFAMMGIASYWVYQSASTHREKAVAFLLYGLQLTVNFFWTLIFFRLGWYLFAFFWLLLLWGLILCTILLFYRFVKKAGYLLFPYLAWVTFAGYLNFGIYLLN